MLGNGNTHLNMERDAPPVGGKKGGLKSRDLETGQTGGTGEKLGYLPYHLAGDGSR